MRCLSKFARKTRKGIIYMDCGTCFPCRLQHKMDMIRRVKEEYRTAANSSFDTYTYDDLTLPITETADENGELRYIADLRYRDIQLNNKMLRKRNAQLHKLYPVQHWRKGHKWPRVKFITKMERGDKTMRPHAHQIAFNLHPMITNDIKEEIWKLGHINRGEVNNNSINYMMGHHLKKDDRELAPNMEKESIHYSNGIGESYVEDHKKWHRDGMRFYILENGTKCHLPKYWRDKIFTKIEIQKHAWKMQNDPEILREQERQKQKLIKMGKVPEVFEYDQHLHKERTKIARTKFFKQTKL